MFRRTASIVALTGAGLLAAAPFALADPVVIDDSDPGVVVDDTDADVGVLNGLTVLPVQACGADIGIPILSDVLTPSDSSTSDATCSVVTDDD